MLSVEAVQLRLIVVSVGFDATKLVGFDGGVVSGVMFQIIATYSG